MQETQPYKNILVAIDLEHKPEEIIDKATLLARSLHAKIFLVYVAIPLNDALYASGLSLLPPIVDIDSVQKSAITAAKAKLNELCNRHLGQITSAEVLIGHPAQQIVQAAEDKQADLIVIGSHGKKGIQLLLGSTATAVLHHAKCDTLALRI